MELKYPVYQPFLSGNEKTYVIDCLDTNWISSRGKYIGAFEKQFAGKVEAKHATTSSNGTTALLLALLALGIQPGDEVIVPTLVYIAVPNMVRVAGGIPVFVDSLPGTWQMDPDDIRRKIRLQTKAVIAVHNYGYPCDMDSIQEICREHGLFLLEDCAEALGSTYKGQPVGSWGDISIYSFFGNKTLTTGEGGMITSNNEELIRKAFHLKNQGVTEKVYWHDTLAYNFRMTNITAAIGLAQLEQLDKVLKRKREIAFLYNQLFDGTAYEVHKEGADIHHSYWMCSILAPEYKIRDPLRNYLFSEGIETRPFFYPAHTMPVYQKQNRERHPVAEDLAGRGINLPSYPALLDEDVKEIVSKVLTFALPS